MRIRWRITAVSDLAKIYDYIANDNPVAALSVTERVSRAVDHLGSFPESGRQGRAEGTREVVVSGLPYVVVYTVEEDFVDVIAVFHAAQDRPR